MYFDALRRVFHESKKAVAGDPSKPSRWVYAGLPVGKKSTAFRAMFGL